MEPVRQSRIEGFREDEDMFKELEEAWSKDSGGYDELIKKQLSNAQDVAYWSSQLKRIVGDEPQKILDVGCGPGFLSILLTRLGHEVKAIDGSEGMVKCAAGNFAAEGVQIAVEEEDAVRLPTETDESFDIIISRDVVWTLYAPEEAFCRWKEVLKPGGKVVIYDGNYRRDQHSWRISLWKCFSQLLSAITEKKLPHTKAHHDDKGVFAALPMVTAQRPDKDMELLKKSGYKKIQITKDKYRNSPRRMEFWKYGYQGEKFRVIAWK